MVNTSPSGASAQRSTLESGARIRLISRLAFLGLSAATVALIVYWGRYTLFFHDEWGFVMRRVAWNLDSLMSPHNEHWVLGPALIWKLLLEVVGLSTHWPYLLVLALAHVLVAAAIYRFFEREVGGLFAVAAPIALAGAPSRRNPYPIFFSTVICGKSA